MRSPQAIRVTFVSLPPPWDTWDGTQMYVRDPEPLSSLGSKGFGDAVAEFDWSTGQILDCLAECGLDERTLVVFTSDNGPRLELSTRDLQGGVEPDHHGVEPRAARSWIGVVFFL